MIMKPTTPRSLTRLRRVLVFATALAVLPTLPAFAQDDGGGNKRRNQEVEEMLKQSNEHPERVKQALAKLADQRKKLLAEGKEDEAEAIGQTMERMRHWLEENARGQEVQRKQQQDGQDELLVALKKAIHALREQDDEAAAKTLARFAEELARKRQLDEMANKLLGQKGPFQEKSEGSEANRWAGERPDTERGWKKEDLDRAMKQWEKAVNELQPGPQSPPRFDPREQPPQDHRIDELADQVARLTKIVEQLAGRMEETEKKKRVEGAPERVSR